MENWREERERERERERENYLVHTSVGKQKRRVIMRDG